MCPGLPPQWEEIAHSVRTKTGHELVLRMTEASFTSGLDSVDVRLDGEFLGAFTFWWDDEQLDESVEDLRSALSVYLDEELRTEDWWGWCVVSRASGTGL